MAKKIRFSWTLTSLSVIGAFAFLGFALQFGLNRNQSNFLEAQTATVLKEPRDIISFHLTDNQNQPFTEANL